ncbi:hypothetical protein ACFX14_002941 [Malus domestica]
MSAKKKKPKTSFARAGLPTASKLVIDLTFSKGTKNEAARSEHVVLAMSRMASTIADRIVRHKGHVMPLVLNFVPRRLLGAKSGSPLERLAIMKSDKVDSGAKVAPRPIPYAAETNSPAGNEETARVGSCEKSTKPASGEVAEIYVLLKPDLLKTWTLVPSLLMASERYSKAAKEKTNTMVDSELVALKGVDELQRVRVSLFKKNEQLKGEKDRFQASIDEVVGEVSAQVGVAGDEAPDDAAAKSVTAVEGVATE